MKNALLIVLFCGLTVHLSAQDYSKAIGLRGSTWTGITYKQQLKEGRYGEAMLMFRYRGVELTGLYEVHKAQLEEVDRLNWYFGGGAHIGYYAWGWGRGGYGNSNAFGYDPDPNYELTLGIDGILGIEYNIEELPINISLDWKPGFNFIGSSWGVWDNGALSVRYYW